MSKRRRSILTGVILLFAILCWFFPLLHVRPMGGGKSREVKSIKTNTSSKPDSKTRTLEGFVTKATGVIQLWESFDVDATRAKKQFGQQAGLGGAFYFCVRGKGIVESIEKDLVNLKLEGTHRRVCLDLGVVVDNTVREGVGVKASEFTNSQEFNAFSSELNRQIEEQIIAPNLDAFMHGALVDFVGCCKVAGKTDLDPLVLIPIQLKILK